MSRGFGPLLMGTKSRGSPIRMGIPYRSQKSGVTSPAFVSAFTSRSIDEQTSTRSWQSFEEDPMARIMRAAPHLCAEDIKTRLQLDPHPWCRQRWLLIYHALVDPREATDKACAY